MAVGVSGAILTCPCSLDPTPSGKGVPGRAQDQFSGGQIWPGGGAGAQGQGRGLHSPVAGDYLMGYLIQGRRVLRAGPMAPRKGGTNSVVHFL